MLGLIATQVGNYQAAIELFGRALAINARNADCHFDLAQALARRRPPARRHGITSRRRPTSSPTMPRPI